MLIQMSNQKTVSPSITSLSNPEVLNSNPLQISNLFSDDANFVSISKSELAGNSSWVRDMRNSLPGVLRNTTTKMASEEVIESSVHTRTTGCSEKSELFLEIENNAAMARLPWSGQLLPFRTTSWDRSLYEIDTLPMGTLKDLREAYAYIRLANELVWLSEVVSKTGKEMEENYRKLCTSIAECLDRAIVRSNGIS